MSAHIEIRDARKSYDDGSGLRLPVLGGIDLDVNASQFVSILGPSGCGKSTLLNILAGHEPLDSGTIAYNEPSGHGGRGIAVMWQEESLMPWKSAFGNIEFPLIVRGVQRTTRMEIVSRWLEAVGLEPFKNYYPSQLSQGMRKRVALAASLATNPSILLMDEPLSALDAYTKLQVEKEIINLWEESNCTILMVTHDVQEAVALSDRIVLLTDRPARVKFDREVLLPRPRNLHELYGDTKFHLIVRDIWAELSGG